MKAYFFNSHLRRMILITLLSISPASLQASANCFQFRVVGICIWIWPYPLNIDVTIKIGHFNPDVLAFVMREGTGILDQFVPTYDSEGTVREDTQNRSHNNLMFKEILLTGNPLAGIIYCPSQSETTLYFESEVDIPSWKWGGLDMLALTEFLRDIDVDEEWGHVYPRSGWVIQHSDPKTAGVVAQRAGDIITREDQVHIYNDDLASGLPIFVEDEMFTWAPGELIENTNEEGWWEPIQPVFEIECDVFGETDSDENISDDGDYTYILWRPYTCCEVGAGFLIYIDFMSYPDTSDYD